MSFQKTLDNNLAIGYTKYIGQNKTPNHRRDEMKIIIKKVKLTNGNKALKVTADYSEQSANFLRKWGTWKSEKKYWIVTEDAESFIRQATAFYKRLYGTAPIVE